MKVKALEWRSPTRFSHMWLADSLFGEYRAWEIDDGFWWREPMHGGAIVKGGLEAAKAAAQADYEARVLSALEPAPSSLVAEPGEPVAWTSQGQLDAIAKGGTGTIYGKPDEFPPIALYAAPPARQDGALREALDLDKAVSTAALTWCGEKDRETFQSDVDYFKHNWRALPGLTAYVDRELGKRARAALAQSAPVKAGGRDGE